MKKKIGKFIQYIWPPLLVLAVIFYLCCLIPVNDIPKIKFNFFIPTDKIVHFIMFWGLALTASINYIIVNKGKIIILKMILFAVIFSIICGGLIEIIQAEYFPARNGDWYDFLADTLGALASIPFALWFRRFILNRNNS